MLAGPMNGPCGQRVPEGRVPFEQRGPTDDQSRNINGLFDAAFCRPDDIVAGNVLGDNNFCTATGIP